MFRPPLPLLVGSLLFIALMTTFGWRASVNANSRLQEQVGVLETRPHYPALDSARNHLAEVIYRYNAATTGEDSTQATTEWQTGWLALQNTHVAIVREIRRERFPVATTDVVTVSPEPEEIRTAPEDRGLVLTVRHDGAGDIGVRVGNRTGWRIGDVGLNVSLRTIDSDTDFYNSEPLASGRAQALQRSCLFRCPYVPLEAVRVVTAFRETSWGSIVRYTCSKTGDTGRVQTWDCESADDG